MNAPDWNYEGTDCNRHGYFTVQCESIVGTLSEVRSRSPYTGSGRLMSTCRPDDWLVVKEALRNRYFTSTDLQGLQSPGRPSVITFHAVGGSA